MADSVSRNTRSKGTLALVSVLGAGVGEAVAAPSSGRDDNPGLTQTPMQTLSFQKRQCTERGPSRFGSQGPQAAPDVSSMEINATRASPTAPGNGASPVHVSMKRRLTTIGTQNVGLLGTLMPTGSNYSSSSSSSDSECESANKDEVSTPFRSPAPSRIGPGPVSKRHQNHLDLLCRAYPPRGTGGNLTLQKQTTPRPSHVSSHSRAGSTRSSRVEDTINPEDSISGVSGRHGSRKSNVSRASTTISRTERLEDKVVRMGDTVEQLVCLVQETFTRMGNKENLITSSGNIPLPTPHESSQQLPQPPFRKRVLVREIVEDHGDGPETDTNNYGTNHGHPAAFSNQYQSGGDNNRMSHGNMRTGNQGYTTVVDHNHVGGLTEHSESRTSTE